MRPHVEVMSTSCSQLHAENEIAIVCKYCGLALEKAHIAR